MNCLKLNKNIDNSKYLPMNPKVSGKHSVKRITMAKREELYLTNYRQLTASFPKTN